MDYDITAGKILHYIGTEKNIKQITNCATRLRFCLNDDSLVDEENLKKLELVAGVLRRGDQYQIVIGIEAAMLCQSIKTLMKK